MNTFDLILRFACSLLVGCIVGVEREYKNRPAGMRTHVLVCLGASMIAVLECLLRQELEAANNTHLTLNLGRMSAQVISGVGFLGAGTIFMSQKKIAGLTTAASLWIVACLGLVCGFGFYWIALGCCVVVMMVLIFLQKIIHVNAIKSLEVRYSRRQETQTFLNKYFEEHGIDVIDADFHIESTDKVPDEGHNMYTNIYTLHLPNNINYADIVGALSENPHIYMVRTRNT